MPGQFNCHTQQYKRIPEDSVDSNIDSHRQSNKESNHVLSCYKEPPPSLSLNDAKKYRSNVTVNTSAYISRADFEQAIELAA